jgi:hypothetical protein
MKRTTKHLTLQTHAIRRLSGLNDDRLRLVRGGNASGESDSCVEGVCVPTVSWWNCTQRPE